MLTALGKIEKDCFFSVLLHTQEAADPLQAGTIIVILCDQSLYIR